MVEVEKEYASKGVAGAALGTGIAGLSLGAINSVCALLANRNATAAPAATAMPAVPYGMGYAPGGCSDNMPVSRYELEREQKLAAKDSEIALLKANTYNDQKDLQMYAYIDAQLKEIRKEQSDQAVRNQRVEDAFALVRQDVECVRSDLSKDIKIEAERRCCGDNAIVTYANATFYAKQVADVTTGTGTTAQTLYNPLPKCGSGCCNGN
jgi:hypothetical protein